MRLPKIALVFAIPLMVGSLTYSADAKNDRGGRGDDRGDRGGHGGTVSTPLPVLGGLLGVGPAGAILYWIVRRYRRED